MKLPVSGIVAALLVLATSVLAGAAAQTVPSAISGTVGRADAPDSWRSVAGSAATSNCIGSIRSPACALDTVAACIARRRDALCEIGSSVVHWVWKDYFLSLSSAGARTLEYRIVGLKPLTDDSLLNWQERAEGAVQVGDARMIVAYRACGLASDRPSRCDDIRHLIMWARPDELGWRIVDWDHIEASALNSAGDDLGSSYVLAMIAAATAAQARKPAAEIRAIAPTIHPRQRFAPFIADAARDPGSDLAALIAPDPPGTWRNKPQPRPGDECPEGRGSPVCVVHSFLTCYDWINDERICGPIDHADLVALTARESRHADSQYRIVAVRPIERTSSSEAAAKPAGDLLPEKIRVAVEFRDCVMDESFRIFGKCVKAPFVLLDLRRNGNDWYVIERDRLPDVHYLNLARDGYVKNRFRRATSRELAAMIAPPEIGRPDPPDLWHHTTKTGTNSPCLGSVASPRCTIDTARACAIRGDSVLCDAVGWDVARGAPGPEYEAYRIQSLRILKAGQLTRLEVSYALRPGDLRVLIKQRICGLPQGCIPTFSEVNWLRRLGEQWVIVYAANVDERYNAANFIYGQD